MGKGLKDWGKKEREKGQRGREGRRKGRKKGGRQGSWEGGKEEGRNGGREGGRGETYFLKTRLSR